MAFCQVIVDIAHEDVDRVFTYRVPEGMKLCPGMRVHVPFGRVRRVEGVVVAMAEACDLPPERVRDVTDVLEDYPAVLPGLLRLAMRIRESSFCTLAQALRLMFPAQMRGERIRNKTREVVVLTCDRTIGAQLVASQARAPKRAQVLAALLESESDETPVEALRQKLGECRQPLMALCKMGFARIEEREALRSP